MRAINQVVPGLPTSYLTNSQGFDVDNNGGKFSSVISNVMLLPVYHTADGKLSVMRWHFDWQERLRLLLPATELEYVYPKDSALVSDSCFYRAKTGKLSGRYVLPKVKFGIAEWARFLATGDMWQVLKNIDGRFVPVRLSGKLPVSIDEEIRERDKYSYLGVMMAGKNMVPGDGQGVIGEIVRNAGKFTIKSHPLAGSFVTENEAVFWLVKRLRETYKGKWDSGKDAMSYGDYPKYETLMCPKCDVPLIGSVGNSGYPSVGFYGCPKCHGRYSTLEGGLKSKRADFDSMAAAAGFTEAQVNFLWNVLGRK